MRLNAFKRKLYGSMLNLIFISLREFNQRASYGAHPTSLRIHSRTLITFIKITLNKSFLIKQLLLPWVVSSLSHSHFSFFIVAAWVHSKWFIKVLHCTVSLGRFVFCCLWQKQDAQSKKMGYEKDIDSCRFWPHLCRCYEYLPIGL